MNKKTLLSYAMIAASLFSLEAQENTRWNISPDGYTYWKIEGSKLPHEDHIEMSGKKVSTVVRYGVDAEGNFSFNRGMVWPLLRTIPNDTHASLMRKIGNNVLSTILINKNNPPKESVKEIQLNGWMNVISRLGSNAEMKRTLFPSVDKAAFCEIYELKNISDKSILVEVPSSESIITTPKEQGVEGAYKLVVKQSGITVNLKPNETTSFTVMIGGFKQNESITTLDIEKEFTQRKSLINELSDNLVLETPDASINTMFRFAKIRGAESIYDTKGGLMHGPGGESYYAAIWANDQAEYIGPFFPFLGYKIGNESSLNAYKHFARFINPEYKPIPSSIIAEGDDTWGGAGDRGDAAMIAYGAARYALAQGDKQEAEELWPLIEWCLEFSKRKITTTGVVASDTDELEGRFPAGKANLCTSSLYYDALLSADYLGKALNKPGKQLAQYREEAKALRKAIDKHFGASVENFNTYRYYEGNDVLRSWICIPLTVGIFDRKEETIKALFSPRLWTKEGLLTQAGSETFWDRSTLYALRGVFASGETEKAHDYLAYYSKHRLLGEHVPYAIEAWPEGSQRHLSAESGLYCRIITEGMFGIRPTGFNTFECSPRLPEEWNEMALRKIRLFGKSFDIEVKRNSKNITMTVKDDKNVYFKQNIRPNEIVSVRIK